jgi:hypothetical protein
LLSLEYGTGCVPPTALLCEHFALPLADAASVSFAQKRRQRSDIHRDPPRLVAINMI